MVYMWWSNLLHLSARITGFACLTALLVQCVEADVDRIPFELTLKKGPLYTDPVVQTSPTQVMVIPTLKNPFETRMNSFTATPRPTTTSAYSVSVVQPISQTALSGHVFQWQSTKQPVMMVALFNQVVEVDTKTNEISNKEALIWLWTPTKGSIDPGQIAYLNGQMASWNKETKTFDLSSPAKMPAIGYYVWCVIAWDKQAINIIAASRELPIRIQ